MPGYDVNMNVLQECIIHAQSKYIMIYFLLYMNSQNHAIHVETQVYHQAIKRCSNCEILLITEQEKASA